MDKKQVAEILHDIGVLLELKGENHFKVRAYLNASRAVEMLGEEIAGLVAEGRIRQVKGIGNALAEKIATLVTTGELPYYQELRASIPQGLLEMLRIPGLGPKRIYALHTELGIADIAGLAYACHENRLLDLKGFGQKTQQSLLKGIDFIKSYQGQFLYGQVVAQAQRLLVQLGKCGAIQDISIAGSLRRCKEIVKDIDLVVSSPQPDKVTAAFIELSGIREITSSGATKTSVILDGGISSDLRVVAPDEFPSALHHFTGSKEHNTALRQRAKSEGVKINEYGLFRGSERMPICDEEDLFGKLGLAYIPPELRENMGEIEAAAMGDLPDLVCPEDIRGTFHVHTNRSDGINTLEELVAEARKAGFAYIGISDHSQTASYANGLKTDAVKQQHEEIREFNSRHPDFYVFHGIESDIHPDGSLDYEDDILAMFDFVIASVHSAFSMTREQATHRIIRALQYPCVTMLGHPTGRLLLGRQGYDPDMGKIIRAAREHNVVIELNANPLRLDIDWRYLKLAKEQGVVISINPDAHRREGLYDTFIGVGIARKGWLEASDVLNAWPVERVKHHFALKHNR